MNIKKKNTQINKVDTINRLKEIVEHSLRSNTRKAYKNALTIFADYLKENNINEVNTKIILFFLTSQSEPQKQINKKTKKEKIIIKKYSTIKLYYAAIKAYCNEKNIQLDTAKIKTFFRGLRNEKESANGAKALELNELNEIIQNIDTTSLQGKRNKAILLLSFFGAFRRSELANLNVGDIVETSKGLTIRVLNSKTDKDKTGLYKAIPYNFKNKNLCTVNALKDYLQSAQITDNSVFRTIRKGGKITDNRISTTDIYRIVKKYAKDFSPHSLRAGFVTTASEKGANAQSIMQQTGHKTVQMIAHYTRSKTVWQNNAVNML